MSIYCKYCDRDRDAGEFYPYQLHKCKECHREAVKEWGIKNSERRAAYERTADRARSRREYAQDNPRIRNAHKAIENAIRRGKLVNPNHCSKCNKDIKTVAHHDDYSLPNIVRWLCSSCHKQWHAINGPGKNA